jgi:acetylglutamate kinase
MFTKENVERLIEITGNQNDSIIFLESFKSLEPHKFSLVYLHSETVVQCFHIILFDLELLLSLDLFPTIIISKSSFEYIHLFYKNLNQQKFSFINSDTDLFENVNINILNKKISIIVLQTEIDSIIKFTELVNLFDPKKFILIDLEAPLKDNTTGEKISLINLRDEIKLNLNESQMSLFNEISSFMKLSNSSKLQFAYTTPFGFLKELFTIKGSGTFIKKGSEIIEYKDINSIDLSRLKNLLEISFKKNIKTEFFSKKIDSILLEKEYNGAALFIKTEFGFYLSKFAVGEIARGEGIGRDIWEKMKQTFSTIFWRSKINNPINHWYRKECQGFHKTEKWIYYWIQFDIKYILNLFNYLENLEEDFY